MIDTIHRASLAPTCLVCALLGAPGFGASAQTAPAAAMLPAPVFSSASHEELKAAYLYCDRLATTELFDGGAAAACSMVYEALKARVFGGDYQRLLAWQKTQQHTAKANAAAVPKP